MASPRVPRHKNTRVLMLLENAGYPEDSRVRLEAESLAEAGYSVAVICPTGDRNKPFEQISRVTVYRYPKPWEFGGVLGYVSEYAYSILMQFVLTCWVYLRHGFDIIHLHAPPDMNAVIPRIFQMLGKRFVYDMHDLSPELYQAQRAGKDSRVIRKALLFFERFAVRRADRLIATNQTQRDIQIDRCGADPNSCYVVRNGPSTAILDSHEDDAGTVEASPVVIGYVGMIGLQDGVDYLIRALDHLRYTLGHDNFRAVIVGGGPALDQVKTLASELRLTKHIEFTGLIPPADVPAAIVKFDICTTPDPSNAYNDSCTTIKTMEYMALGKPSVCFETPENEKTAGDSALYAVNNDIADYAMKLKQLLDSPQRRRQMGQAARARIENGLTWQHQSKQLVQLYDEISGVKRNEPAANPEPVRHSVEQVNSSNAPQKACS